MDIELPAHEILWAFMHNQIHILGCYLNLMDVMRWRVSFDDNADIYKHQHMCSQLCPIEAGGVNTSLRRYYSLS